MLTDIFSYLSSGTSTDPTRQAALTALQSAVVTASPFYARIYTDLLKERSTMPALVFRLIDSNHGYILEGTPISIEYPRVQIDVYSNDSVERETISGYVKTALDGYIGTMFGTNVGIVMYENEQNEYLPDSLQYRKMLDFKVVHYS